MMKPSSKSTQPPRADSENDSSSQSSSFGDSMSSSDSSSAGEDYEIVKATRKRKRKQGKPKMKGTKADYVRLDNVWNTNEHRYELRKSSERPEAGKYEQYAFKVRRKFNWENKHTGTCLDIMSKPLKAALRHIMGQVKGISLDEDQPSVDPNTIFLFLGELRAYMKTLRAQSKTEKKRKTAKEIALKAQHLEVLIKYLDQDYDKTKKSLYPLLESKKITFDLLWALFKSNEIIYTPTYNTEDVPRAFSSSMPLWITRYSRVIITKLKDATWNLTGKNLGWATSKYHQDPAKLEKELIERGKKFADWEGMKFGVQTGMAFYKKHHQIFKISIDGRVMIDPANFRHFNPNYPISTLKPEDKDILSDSESDDSDKSKDNSSDGEGQDQTTQFDNGKKPKPRKKWVKDKKTDKYHCVDVPVGEEGNVAEKIEEIPSQNDSGKREFTDEEYLIASPVVLGFSFGDKRWLEFAVGGIRDIAWNESAFDALVIPNDQKQVVKSLVSSHERNAGKNITDIIQG
ncbi:hypothetical protein ABVK25_010153 [Lepraria finkii]|uniref:DUF7025 domain-containing protein n=1 Tax=Lepraria finkii TaxID=1340010 RepID=A0ABR4AV61_9LECA